MEILSTKIKHITLVHHNEIPLIKLISGKNLSDFAELFGFRESGAVQDPTGNVIGAQFRFGIFLNKDGHEFAINRLMIEERKIQVDLEGRSDFANEFYSHIVNSLVKLSETTDSSTIQPIVVAYESELIARLDFIVYQLLAPDFLAFVNSTVSNKATSEQAVARVTPSSIKFLIDYSVEDNYLTDHGILLSRKEFSVQPAIGHPIDEQIFYSKAPFDTDTHINILEELEASIKEKSKVT